MRTYLGSPFNNAAPEWCADSRTDIQSGLCYTSLSKTSLKFFMRTPSFNLDQLAQKLGEVFRQSPARDLEQNLKSGLSGWFSKLDLVTREEFDVQAEVLSRTREKLTQLEARLKELEARHQPAQD